MTCMNIYEGGEMSWNNSDSAHEFRRSFPHPTDSLSFMRSSLSERLLSVSSRARHCENKYLIRVRDKFT